MKRCKSISHSSNIRCGLPEGHNGAHQNFFSQGVTFWHDDPNQVPVATTDWDMCTIINTNLRMIKNDRSKNRLR